MRVLALDPGERVGWARADVDDSGTWDDFRHGITPLRDMAMAVHRALTDHDGYDVRAMAPQYDVVVVEDWRLYPHLAKSMIGSSFPSVQFIGMVRLSCWLSNTKIVTQGAGIKTTADKMMAKVHPDLYELVTRPVAHDDGHDQDAIRHLFYWTTKNTTLLKGGS